MSVFVCVYKFNVEFQCYNVKTKPSLSVIVYVQLQVVLHVLYSIILEIHVRIIMNNYTL